MHAQRQSENVKRKRWAGTYGLLNSSTMSESNVKIVPATGVNPSAEKVVIYFG